MNTTSEKLSSKTWFIVLFLIVLFPVGLFLMWKNKEFDFPSRVILSIFISIVFLSFFVDVNLKTDTEVSTEQVETEYAYEYPTEVETEYVEEEVVEDIPDVETLEDYIPTESYFSYNGSGDDVVTGLVTEPYSMLKFTSNNDHHKSIKAHYGDDYDLLVNDSGAYSGGTLLYPDAEYTLEINATGDWNIEVFAIGSSSSDSFSGTGDWVTPIFVSTSNIYEIITEGENHFTVKGYYNDGDYDLLVNTTDGYSGKVMFPNKGGYAFFEVTGTRDWSIAPVDE